MDARQASDKQQLQAGQQIAGYRILELIGAGGMGRVYRAEQIGLERIVALKVIRPELAALQGFRERFRREARLAASVDHQGVVPVYEAGEADGVLFVAMRWVNGPTLRRVLDAEAPLAPARAAGLLAQLAEALEAAHAVGLVHRDIKPSNVLIESGRAYLSDFGLARPTAEIEATTQTAGFVGTVDYAAPEQLDGGPVDARSDIYALGCVLYEMLTGAVPYPAEGLLAKVRAHASEQPPAPTALRPELPSAFDPVIATALAKDPAKRYESAAQLAEAARAALRSAPRKRRRVAPAALGRFLRRRRVALGLSLAAIAAAVAAVLVLTAGSDQPTSSRNLGHDLAHLKTAPASLPAGSRPLPGEGSLLPCGKAMDGPPRTCRVPGKDGGIDRIVDQGETLHMSTMDVQVGIPEIKRELQDENSGITIRAQPGRRFVVIPATVTNITKKDLEFEPDSGLPTGRQTVFWVFNDKGRAFPTEGPHYIDYSAEEESVVGALPLGLSQRTLVSGLPYIGQLVYQYPAKDLRGHPRAFLQFAEFGALFHGSSYGGFRLTL